VSRIALLSEEAFVNYMVISYCVQDSPFIRGSLCKLQKEIREKTHGLDMDKARIPQINPYPYPVDHHVKMSEG
jgi:hypothetical protein